MITLKLKDELDQASLLHSMKVISLWFCLWTCPANTNLHVHGQDPRIAIHPFALMSSMVEYIDSGSSAIAKLIIIYIYIEHYN